MPLGMVVVAVAVVALLGYVVKTQPEREEKRQEKEAERLEAAEKKAAKSECEAIEDRLMSARQQGADAAKLASLEADLFSCAERTGTLAPWQVLVKTMRGKRQQMDAEFAHYRSTSWSDSAKRANTIGTIMRLGDEYVTAAREALREATGSREAHLQLLRELEAEGAASDERFVCHATICGNGDWDRAHGELIRVLVPIWGLARVQETRANIYNQLNRKLAQTSKRALGQMDPIGLLGFVRQSMPPEQLRAGVVTAAGSAAMARTLSIPKGVASALKASMK